MLHFNMFKALAEVLEHHVGNTTNGDALINLKIKKTFPEEDVFTLPKDNLLSFRTSLRNKALVVAFVKRCDHTRYGGLVDNLE